MGEDKLLNDYTTRAEYNAYCREKNRRWRQQNKQHCQAYHHQYYQAHKQEKLEQAKQYYREHIEAKRIYRQKRCTEIRIIDRERSRQYYLKNKDKILARKKSSYHTRKKSSNQTNT